MSIVLCTLVMSLGQGSFGIVTSEQVKGELLIEGYSHYLVDFSVDIKNFGITGDYTKIVEKEDCKKL